MRSQINKLKKGKSTKAERRFAELLKQERIPFTTKVPIQGREVDFVIGKYAVEIDGHPQDADKNVAILRAGYIPYHLLSWEVGPHLKELVHKLNGRN